MINKIMLVSTLLYGLTSLLILSSCNRKEIPITDFETPGYGNWKVEGEAFGAEPSPAEDFNQSEIKNGFSGRFANSNTNGRKSQGKLVSPEFTIRRNYLSFLLTGPSHFNEEKCNLRLIINDSIVRYAAGTRFPLVEWTSVKTSGFIGQTARIELVDSSAKNFIMVDRILQTDEVKTGPYKMTFPAEKKYLLYPVSKGARQYRLRLEKEGFDAEQFVIEMGEGEPDFWAFRDISRYKGKELTLFSFTPTPPKAFEKIRQSDTIPGERHFYQEKERPQFHFTPRQGWLNDPNGLVYYEGEWHLMFQHNPYGRIGSLKHWGHAVSKDLFHWKEMPSSVVPGDLGSCHSGGAVVDHNNASGLQKGEDKTLIAFWTAAGHFVNPVSRFTQCLSYSNDKGRTWDKYQGNPIIGHIEGRNRDPKVRWHSEAKHWVMALFLGNQHYAFFKSDNLIDWEMTGKIKMPANECPDIFQLPLDGDEQNKKWIFWGGNGKYVIGDFDGEHFTIEGEAQQTHYGNRYYAAMSFNNAPEGRIIQIGWLVHMQSFKNANYVGQLSVPNELKLQTNPSGVPVLYANPVPEIKTLRKQKQILNNISITENPFEPPFSSELSDIYLETDMTEANEFIAEVRGVPVVYNKEKEQLNVAGTLVPMKLPNDRLSLRILVDRLSVEVFGNGGEKAVFITKKMNPQEINYAFRTDGGRAEIKKLEMYALESAWE